MPMKIKRDASGNPLISIPAFSADEIRLLSGDIDAEPPSGVREYRDNEGMVRVSNDAGFYVRQLQNAHDRLYEMQRDGDLEIQRRRDRASRMALLAGIGWFCWLCSMVSLWWVAK